MYEALERMELPRSIAGSRLVARGGFSVVCGLVGDDLFEAIQNDATSQASSRHRGEFAGPNTEEWRGGHPARALAGSPSGPVQFSVYGSAEMAGALGDVCGFPLRCAGAGSYSWYTQAGDHLALHRDIVKCDVTVITCLEQHGPILADAGVLRVYPEHLWHPLSQVKSGGIPVPIRPGESVVIAGGIVPHEVLPSVEGQHRVVSIVCYVLA